MISLNQWPPTLMGCFHLRASVSPELGYNSQAGALQEETHRRKIPNWIPGVWMEGSLAADPRDRQTSMPSQTPLILPSLHTSF